MKDFKKYILLSLILILFCIGLFVYNFFSKCSWEPTFSDIYDKYPLGSSIDSVFNDMPKSNKFAITDDYLIAKVDRHKKTEVYSYHLLFYGKDLTLQYAYYTNMSLDSIFNGIIYGSYKDSLSYKKDERIAKYYRRELPPGYQVDIKIKKT